MCFLQVFLALLSILSLTTGQSLTYYVHPSSDKNLCPSTPCFTLSYYTTNPEQFFVSGATFVFLPGKHQLTTSGFVVIRDVADLTLVGSQNVPLYLSERNSTVSCPFGLASGFAFINVSNLHIRDLGFEFCGAIIPPDLATEALTVQTTSSVSIPNNTLKSALFLVNVHSLDMNAVLVSRSFGYGLLAINAIGEVFIQKCSFWLNNVYTSFVDYCRFPKDDADIHKCVGGNARFIYSDPSECPTSAESYTVEIHQSAFVGGVDFHGSVLPEDVIRQGSGFGVTFAQRVFGVRLLLSGAIFFQNKGLEGANLYVSFYNHVENSSVSIHNCQFLDGNVMYPHDVLFNTSQGASGVGMYFKHGILGVNPHGEPLVCENFTFRGEATQEILAIHGSSFNGNVGLLGGLGVGMLLSILPHANPELKRTITINDVHVTDNVGFTGVGLWLSDYLSNPQLDVTITNSTFSVNKLIIPIEQILKLDFGYIGPFKYLDLGTVQFKGANNVTINNSSFFGNGVTAILASNSKINFGGTVQFFDNIGSNGGALSLFGDSVLYLPPHLHMTFENNFAFRRGGAIYIDTYFSDQCFFQVTDPTFLPTSQLDIRLTFWDNTALEAGDILYGGGIDECVITTLSAFRYEDIGAGEIFDSLADHDMRQADSNSLISSDPDGACFCEGDKPDCENSTRSVDLFPGQSFQVPVMAVGQRNGVSPAVMRAYFVAPSTAQFGHLQELQDTERHCVNLTYTVSTYNDTETIYFIPHESLFIHAPMITTTFLPCPVGFKLAEEQGICSCSKPLQHRHATCDIEDETITRVSPYWFSAASGELAFHDHCPFDYCRDETVKMNLAEPDTQCAFHRSGILCGGCRDGYSLSLGTSKCQKCTNVYFLHLIPFAIMGVLLVLFLSLLNLTVKVGTIHGLIFYANVVKINQAAFFPPGEVSFFTVFLSWLNLDFGIESCFYDGLDEYSKAWLQFAFPLYIWAIGVTIIVSAHYSTRVSQVFSNVVHVLDTLFLLSYTKILRAIITALSFTSLEYEGEEEEIVWLYDGNVKYGEGKHIALIVFGLIFLLLALPYTFVLLFAHLLRRYSHKCAFRWVVKIKPFLDAYTGPYKDNHGYWTGLLLLARVVFVLVFAFNSLGDPAINIMVVTIVSFLLAILGKGVYKTWMLDVLEASFLINLGILSTATCYISDAGGNQQVLIRISIAIVFVELLGILVYHIILRLKKRYGFNWPQLPDYHNFMDRFRHVQLEPETPFGLEELIRPGTEGLFDDETDRMQNTLHTTYVDIRDLGGRD